MPQLHILSNSGGIKIKAFIKAWQYKRVLLLKLALENQV
jgi:hypothetical protein